jgi:hypothetical protein
MGESISSDPTAKADDLRDHTLTARAGVPFYILLQWLQMASFACPFNAHDLKLFSANFFCPLLPPLARPLEVAESRLPIWAGIGEGI